jgi:hypothetical protein
MEAARYVTADLNGDGVFSTEHDRFGFAGVCFENDQPFAASTDAVIIRKDADNLPVYADQNVERINEVYATVYDLCIGNPSLYVSMSDYIASPDLAEMPAQAFAEGRVLFYGTTLQGAIELMTTGASMGILRICSRVSSAHRRKRYAPPSFTEEATQNSLNALLLIFHSPVLFRIFSTIFCIRAAYTQAFPSCGGVYIRRDTAYMYWIPLMPRGSQVQHPPPDRTRPPFPRQRG